MRWSPNSSWTMRRRAGVMPGRGPGLGQMPGHGLAPSGKVALRMLAAAEAEARDRSEGPGITPARLRIVQLLLGDHLTYPPGKSPKFEPENAPPVSPVPNCGRQGCDFSSRSPQLVRRRSRGPCVESSSRFIAFGPPSRMCLCSVASPQTNLHRRLTQLSRAAARLNRGFELGGFGVSRGFMLSFIALGLVLSLIHI